MNRVLVTGGTGTIGTAVVRRLLGDPAYEVRVADQQPAPQWMREGCEVHTGDLRVLDEARRATDGCSHVIHLAAAGASDASNLYRLHTLMEANNALYNAVIRAAVDLEVERFTYVSSAMVFERASEFPSTEAHLPDCPTPESAYGFSKLTGERYCRAAHDEHGLQYTICRPCDAYGPGAAPGAQPGGAERSSATHDIESGAASAVDGLIARVLAGQRPLQILGSGEQTRTPTHVEDIAAGIVTAMSSPRGRNEDFNIAASRELTVAEIARIVWEACGEEPANFALEHLESAAVNVPRRWPSVEKAGELLGWQARINLEDGIETTVEWVRERGSVGSPA
jgi:nucleoside-diphosphate-sugar epimerase